MNKYILTEAFTDSEWDPVSFALVQFSEETCRNILSLRDRLGDDIPADSATINGDFADFFTDEEELPEDIDGINDQIIEIEDIEKLSRPEQYIKYGEVKIYPDWAVVRAVGKHTGEDYWCDISYSTIEQYLETLKTVTV